MSYVTPARCRRPVALALPAPAVIDSKRASWRRAISGGARRRGAGRPAAECSPPARRDFGDFSMACTTSYRTLTAGGGAAPTRRQCFLSAVADGRRDLLGLGFTGRLAIVLIS